MTKEQVEQLQELNFLFIGDCNRVVDVLKNYEAFNQYNGEEIQYAKKFRISEGGSQVVWEGDEYWYGGHEHHSGTFPIEYVAMSDGELFAEAERINGAHLEAKRKEKEAEEAKKAKGKKSKEMDDYQTYLRLKKQFEQKG